MFSGEWFADVNLIGVKYIGPGLNFSIYCVMGIISFIFIQTLLTETKQKEPNEILFELQTQVRGVFGNIVSCLYLTEDEEKGFGDDLTSNKDNNRQALTRSSFEVVTGSDDTSNPILTNNH